MGRTPDGTGQGRDVVNPKVPRVWSRRSASAATGDSGARTRILDAAEELFAEHGYDATPTAKLARRAEVPKGLIFHYFPRKIDVLVALIEERTEVLAVSEHDLRATPGDAAGALSRLAGRFPLHASPAMRRILFREADTHRSVRDRLGRLNREVAGHARRVLELTLPGARGDAARLEVAAATFAVVLMNQEHLRQLTGEHLDPDKVADLIAHALR